MRESTLSWSASTSRCCRCPTQRRVIKTTLAGQPGIKAVEGLGLMVGISTERPAGDIVSALLKRGVVALTAKERVRLLPALTIPTDLLKEALDIILDEAARV